MARTYRGLSTAKLAFTSTRGVTVVSVRGFAGKSLVVLVSTYCLLLILFPVGWLVLLSGAMLNSHAAKKLLGVSIPATKTVRKPEHKKELIRRQCKH
jgi:enterochelin esterase-like enzyme